MVEDSNRWRSSVFSNVGCRLHYYINIIINSSSSSSSSSSGAHPPSATSISVIAINIGTGSADVVVVD